MDCSPPGSFVHGISQARILEQVAISSSRASSQPRDRNPHLLHWQVDSLSNEPPGKLLFSAYMCVNHDVKHFTNICLHSLPTFEPCTVVIPILLMIYSEVKLQSYLKGTLGCEAIDPGSAAVLSTGMCYFVSAYTLSGSNECISLTPALAL